MQITEAKANLIKLKITRLLNNYLRAIEKLKTSK